MSAMTDVVSVDPWVWAVFLGFIAALLAVDLVGFHREAHVVETREAAVWSAIWIALGTSFTFVVWAWMGPAAAGEYIAGYLIEKSLSVDNIFVFALIFSYFSLPAQFQHRVLFWGIFTALVFRGVFIAGGAALLDRFEWMIFVFGGFLVVTGVRMALSKHADVHPEHNPVLRLVRRMLPMTTDYRGQSFFVKEAGRRFATPLVAVLVVVETSDVIFAIDSIPAIFAVTRNTFLVFSSNAFAILGLRALFFLLSGMMRRFAYLNVGLAIVLVFVGVKMLIAEWYHIPIWTSLVFIAVTLTVTIAASWRRRLPVE